MSPTTAEESAQSSLPKRIEATGRELRGALTAVLEAVAGPQPRPTRVARAIGIDKSLASRLVRAVQATSDFDLMHLVPSPGGLEIFVDLSRRYADPASLENLRTATRHFDELVNSVPGGRAAIDAQISDSSPVALSRREHIAKQASFKAMSFLLGHFCDVLSTTLFLVPSATPDRVDGIELHRRIGLRRMRPSTPLALLSFWGDPDDAMSENRIRMVTIDGEPGAVDPQAFLLPEFSTQPLPELDVVHDADMTTLVLGGSPTRQAPGRLTSAFRVLNGWPLVPDASLQSLRGYLLHTPCVQMVREVYIADSLYPDAVPRVSFLLPGPRAAMRPPRADGLRHFSEAELSSTLEQLPLGPPKFDVPGIVNHSAAVRHVLERTGHAGTRFRGWRCRMTYPVTFVELMWWLDHPGVGGKG